MNRTVLILLFAAFTTAAGAQTPPKTATTGSTAAKSASTAAAAAKAAATPAVTAQPQPWIKLPPGVPAVAHGPVKAPISLRYEDVKVGTGAVGESGKVWHLKYTGWRAADGVKFDTWENNRQPVKDPDGKPVLGPDGKPKLGDPQPITVPQGTGRVIPGFDYGVDGMRIGGKRRIFIPWQMAYGMRSFPDRPDRPGIPAKSDLIFDVELVDVTEMPAPRPPVMPQHPVNPPPSAPAGQAAPGVKPALPATPSAPVTTTPPPTAPAQPAATTPPATATQPAATTPPAKSTQPGTPAQPATPPQQQTPQK